MHLLLVHGMGRTRLSLLRLARFLRRQGHATEQVGYVAAVEPFERIVARTRRRLKAIAATSQPYAVIGHSLGGLILRAALDGVTPAPQHLIMLATPNQAPRLAQRLHRFWPYRVFCGESGQLLAQPDFLVHVPRPTGPCTIIAGSAGPRGRWSPFEGAINDWVVAVEETKFRPDDQPVVLPVGHTFMMNDRRVHAVIREALGGSLWNPRD
ncbi:MAG TPA: hypothetical protein VFL88_04030 [Gemmatimonadales bacterium]|nr:hypothetical protein [Gemmatimonadales bacterium]